MRYITRKAKQGFTLIELMIVVAIVGILAVLAVYGVRKYLANAKTAEARNSLGQIAKDAVTAFEKESMAATVLSQGTATGVLRNLCASQSSPAQIPSSMTEVQGKKYQSKSGRGEDWSSGAATNSGFSCLKFSMDQPQYYSYGYTSVASTSGSTGSFNAFANGDLNGDGSNFSTFSIAGAVQNGSLNTAPNISETAPEE